MLDRDALAAGLAAGERLVLNGGARPTLAEVEADPEGAFVVAADDLRGVILDAATDPARRADPRGLRLRGAAIVGVLDLENFTIANDLLLRDCLFVDAITLAGACIAGQLSMRGALLNGRDDDGRALNAQGLEAERDVFLDDVLVSAGGVSLSGANIAGQLSMRGAQLTSWGNDGWSLSAQNLQAGDGVFLDRGFVSSGAITLTGARVAGPLSMRGARLDGQDADGWSLFAELLRTDWSVLLDDGFGSVGAIGLAGARLAGPLIMVDARLDGEDAAGWSLDVRHSQLDGGIRLYRGFRASGTLLFEGAQIRTLVLPEHGELPKLGSVVGWTLGDLQGRPRTDRRAAAQWLESQTTAQPWQELADLYDRIGQPSDARWIRYRSAVRSTRHSPWWSKVGRWIYRVTTGHGYYAAPLTLMWLVVIFAITWGMAAWQAQEFTTPTSDTIRVAVASEPIGTGDEPRFDDESSVPGRVPSRWWTDAWDVPEFGAWNYAIATALPATGLAQPWSPPPGWLPAVFALLRGLSWVFTALFLAGITGLLRKQT